MNEDVKISVVSPVYRAAPIIDKLVERISEEVSLLTSNFEIILVEDRSPDDSWHEIQKNCEKHPHLKGIRLARNSGQQHAMQCGLDASTGDIVITMDCDLQDNPAEIKNLLEKSKEGYDIVIARRKNRQDNFLKKLTSKAFNSLMGYLTETEQDSAVANFVLLNRKAVDALAQMNDYNRYYPMMIQWIGFSTAKVDIVHAERDVGGSSYSFKKRASLALDAIVAFSDKPLRLTVKLGIFLSALSIASAGVLIWRYITTDAGVPGWTSLAVLVSFFAGITISVLGMVGLYVGKTFESVKRRPTYIVDTMENFS